MVPRQKYPLVFSSFLFTSVFSYGTKAKVSSCFFFLPFHLCFFLWYQGESLLLFCLAPLFFSFFLYYLIPYNSEDWAEDLGEEVQEEDYLLILEFAQSSSLSTLSTWVFCTLFQWEGLLFMQVDLEHVFPRAVVQTLAQPLAICQIVFRDKPTRQIAI